MRDFKRGNTVVLRQKARPVGTVTVEEFKRQTEGEENHWGVPIEYFEIERDGVYLNSELATSLRWNVDGVMPKMLNIAALPDRVQISDEEISINPGFWCSNIHKDQVK